MDSFHIKKYFIDVFRGQCIVGYWLTEQVYQTRPYGERKPWDYINSFDDIDKSTGVYDKDFIEETEALAHPDGFPVKVFFNGKNAGIYTFNLKKSRSNYNCEKKNQKQILLDGVIGDEFFTANGNIGKYFWSQFEVKSPKIETDIDGNTYDGESPKEPADQYNECKQAISRFTTAIPLTLAETTDEGKKAKFAEFFNIPFLIDYELIAQILYHYDGFRKNWIWLTNDGIKWTPTIYDLDSIFGSHWNGGSYETGSINAILGSGNNIPTGKDLLKKLYKNELEARYKELRDKGIFSTYNIISLLESWLKRIGYDNLKEDIQKIVVSAYKINNEVVKDENDNPILIPYTPSYRDGSLTYVNVPETGGFYNSVTRVKNWLNQRIAVLDKYYNYNIIIIPESTNEKDNCDNIPQPKSINETDNSVFSTTSTISKKGLSAGAISGIVIGSVLFVCGVLAIIIIIYNKKKNIVKA